MYAYDDPPKNKSGANNRNDINTHSPSNSRNKVAPPSDNAAETEEAAEKIGGDEAGAMRIEESDPEIEPPVTAQEKQANAKKNRHPVLKTGKAPTGAPAEPIKAGKITPTAPALKLAAVGSAIPLERSPPRAASTKPQPSRQSQGTSKTAGQVTHGTQTQTHTQGSPAAAYRNISV